MRWLLFFAHRSDDEIGNEILKRVSEKNYIPSRERTLCKSLCPGIPEVSRAIGGGDNLWKVCVLLSSVPAAPSAAVWKQTSGMSCSEMKLPENCSHTTESGRSANTASWAFPLWSSMTGWSRDGAVFPTRIKLKSG